MTIKKTPPKAHKGPSKAPKPIAPTHTAYRLEKADYIAWRLLEITYQNQEIKAEKVLCEDLKGICIRKLQLEVTRDA